MKCPSCDHYIGWGFLSDEEIEGNDKFGCPGCDIELRLIIDEGTYYGAQEKSLEVVQWENQLTASKRVYK